MKIGSCPCHSILNLRPIASCCGQLNNHGMQIQEGREEGETDKRAAQVKGENMRRQKEAEKRQKGERKAQLKKIETQKLVRTGGDLHIEVHLPI